jgi:nucleoside-triphosphatase THEP1
MAGPVFIITGTQGAGKTTFLQKVLGALTNENFKSGGVISEGFWKDDVRDRFELIDIKTNERVIYCQQEPVAGWNRIGHFFINPKGQSFGENALYPGNLRDLDVVAIDEIGLFELAGKGWSRSFEKVLMNLDVPIIILVRKNLLEQVIRQWNLNVKAIFEVSESKPVKAAKKIIKELKSV